MRVSVRLIILSHCRPYLVARLSPSVLFNFFGGGDPVLPSSVHRAGGDSTDASHINFLKVGLSVWCVSYMTSCDV